MPSRKEGNMQIQRISALGALVFGVIACASAPRTETERRNLEARAESTLAAMTARDPGLASMLESAYGYVVFPEVAKGGAIAGAAQGRGVMYERGQPTGYVVLRQGSVGAQLGGQTYSQLLVLRDRFTADRIRADSFSLGANASAVALNAGAAASAEFVDGVAVFVMPRGGMMAELSVSGQQLRFEPRG
jgi:lipid-binding SYLF domain-containing protein